MSCVSVGYCNIMGQSAAPPDILPPSVWFVTLWWLHARKARSQDAVGCRHVDHGGRLLSPCWFNLCWRTRGWKIRFLVIWTIPAQYALVFTSTRRTRSSIPINSSPSDLSFLQSKSRCFGVESSMPRSCRVNQSVRIQLGFVFASLTKTVSGMVLQSHR